MDYYKRNYLTNVIFRTDFPKILGLDDENPPVQLQKDVKDRFPLLETISWKMVEFKISKEPSTVFENKLSKWLFFSKDKTKVVEVCSDSITIEFFVYKNFKEFFDDIEWVFSKFFSIYDVVRVSNRIGLRYINEIRLEKGDPFDWNSLINPALVLAVGNFVDNKQDIKRSMHSLELKTKECDLKFQFGISNLLPIFARRNITHVLISPMQDYNNAWQRLKLSFNVRHADM